MSSMSNDTDHSRATNAADCDHRTRYGISYSLQRPGAPGAMLDPTFADEPTMIPRSKLVDGAPAPWSNVLQPSNSGDSTSSSVQQTVAGQASGPSALLPCHFGDIWTVNDVRLIPKQEDDYFHCPFPACKLRPGPVKYKHVGLMEQHWLKKHKNRPIGYFCENRPCKNTTRPFGTLEELENHIAVKHNRAVKSCPDRGDKNFFDEDALKKHLHERHL